MITLRLIVRVGASVCDELPGMSDFNRLKTPVLSQGDPKIQTLESLLGIDPTLNLTLIVLDNSYKHRQ